MPTSAIFKRWRFAPTTRTYEAWPVSETRTPKPLRLRSQYVTRLPASGLRFRIEMSVSAMTGTSGFARGSEKARATANQGGRHVQPRSEKVNNDGLF